jgi:hypothetical protein
MPHVVENAQKQDDVELTDRLRRDIEHLHLAVLDLGAEHFASQLEPLLRAPSGTAP